MEKPILLVDFGRLMDDQLRNGLNINKKTFILDDYVVDAIPKWWIREYSRRPLSNTEYWAIIRMVTAWEEENEESN